MKSTFYILFCVVCMNAFSQTSLELLEFRRFDIRSFGAKSSNTPAQNRASILSAITAADAVDGSEVYIPHGNFNLDKAPGIAVFVLSNLTDITFVGEGATSVLSLAAGSYPGDTHIFSLTNCTNIKFKNFKLYGNRGNHSADNEQMHGIRTFDCSYIYIDGMIFDRLRGDGVFLLGNTLNSWIYIHNNRFYSCGRSGITIQRLNRFGSIKHNFFDEINDQAIDSEPTGGIGYDDFDISNNIFNWSTQRNIGVTLGGSGSSGIDFNYNKLINAGLFSTSLGNSRIIGNTIQGPLAILETADSLTISTNQITSPGKCINIYYQNAQPQSVIISKNRCTTKSATENIIEVQVDGVSVTDNVCTAVGSSGTTGTGILIAAPTVTGSYYKALKVTGNDVYNCNTGITVSAGLSKKWISGHLLNNTIGDLRASKSIVYGINLSGPSFYHFDELFVDKNVFDASLSDANKIVLNASGCSWYKITSRSFAGIVEPEGVVSGSTNDVYDYIGTPYKFTKTLSGSSSGWVEKNIELPSVVFNDELLENPQASISSHAPNNDLLTGLSWTNDIGQHDCLTSGEASATTLSGGIAIATLNTGLTSCTIQALIRGGAAGSEYSGIAFRVSDASNYWAYEISAGLDVVRLIKVVSGSVTVVASSSIAVPASGDQVLRVSFSGNTIACSYNGGSVLTAYDSFNATQSKHGIESKVTSRYYFKNFKISTL